MSFLPGSRIREARDTPWIEVPRKVSRSDTSGIVIKSVSGQYWRRSERTRAKDLDIAAEVSRKRQRQYTLCTIDIEGGRSLQDAVAVDMDYRNGSALKYNARRCKVLIRIDIALTEFRMSEIAVFTAEICRILIPPEFIPQGSASGPLFLSA